MTKRIIRAMENPFITMLGHPTGRLLLKREPYQVDIPAILDAAAATGTWIEINAAPKRLDLDWRWWPLAKQKGVKCVINPDAHRVERLQDLWFGIGVARKGWLTKADVVNCLPLGKIEGGNENATQTAARRVVIPTPCGRRARFAQRSVALNIRVSSGHCFIRSPRLRHEHRQTFAGAAGFQELRHRQFMAAITAIFQRGDECRRAFRQNNVAIEHDRVAGEMRGFFRQNIDQLAICVRGWRAARIRQTPLETKPRRHRATDKSRCRDDKSADRQVQPR